MPEARNNFLKSRMNKDLEQRLVPIGEYRDAQNVIISRSEGYDVGALENVLGNNIVQNFIMNFLLMLKVLKKLNHCMMIQKK